MLAAIIAFMGSVTFVYILKEQRDRYKAESIRLSNNAESIRTARKNDSVIYSDVIQTQKEFIQDMDHNYKDEFEAIKKKLDITAKQVTRLQNIKTVYITKDTTSYVLNEILKAIQEERPMVQKVADSTECHLVEANVHFNGKDLRLDVTKVGYTNITDIVAFMEKRKWWTFWKWFKKRKITVSVLNSCGETTTRIVNVTKG